MFDNDFNDIELLENEPDIMNQQAIEGLYFDFDIDDSAIKMIDQNAKLEQKAIDQKVKTNYHKMFYKRTRRPNNFKRR